jgi:NTP pyrophosphatase (non-canonical NTP hydrolase)
VDLTELQSQIETFIDDLGWAGAHSPWPRTPRNMATSVMVEAAELLEHFQWGDEIRDRDGLAAEMADVLIYLLQLATVSGVDLEAAALDKLALNRRRFTPVGSEATTK